MKPEMPRLGQNIMTKDQINRFAGLVALASNPSHLAQSAKIVSFWMEEIEQSISDLMRLSGDPYHVVIEKLSQTKMHHKEAVKYYAKYGQYSKSVFIGLLFRIFYVLFRHWRLR